MLQGGPSFNMSVFVRKLIVLERDMPGPFLLGAVAAAS